MQLPVVAPEPAPWPRATIALAFAFLAVFGVGLVLGLGSDDAAEQARALIRTGATEHVAVFGRGEAWRLLGAAFCHVGIWHLVLNGWAFIQLGSFVEAVYGSWRLLLVFLGSAVASSLASSWGGDSVSAGASGGIMGLLAFLVAASYLHAPLERTLVQATFGRQLLFWGLVTLGLGLLPIPVDQRGHLGGATAGFLMGAVLRDASPAGALVRGLAGLLSGAAIASFVAIGFQGEASARVFDQLARAEEAATKSDRLEAIAALDSLAAAAGSLEHAADGSAARAEAIAEAAIVARRSEVAVRFARLVDERTEGGAPVLLARALLLARSPEAERVLAALRADGSLEELGRGADRLERDGFSGEALELAEEALRRERHEPNALNLVAWTILTSKDEKLRDPRRALVLARKAVLLAPDSSECIDTLAEAELQLGLGDLAIQHSELAARLANQQGSATGPAPVLALRTSMAGRLEEIRRRALAPP